MSDATLQILRDAVKAVPIIYTVPGGQVLGLMGLRATFDGAGAAGAFLPSVQILSAAGAVMVHAEGTSVAAGASADASFFPGVKAAGGGADADDVLFNVIGQTGGLLEATTTTTGGLVPGST